MATQLGSLDESLGADVTDGDSDSNLLARRLLRRRRCISASDGQDWSSCISCLPSRDARPEDAGAGGALVHSVSLMGRLEVEQQLEATREGAEADVTGELHLQVLPLEVQLRFIQEGKV